MNEADRDLGRRCFDEVWNKGQREAIGQLFAPNVLVHDGSTTTSGPGPSISSTIASMLPSLALMLRSKTTSLKATGSACAGPARPHTTAPAWVSLPQAERSVLPVSPLPASRISSLLRCGRTGTCSA